ncbi:MAG: response regulator transcription factor [Lachnospiraceae bacterium]|nr:response regulator transcription factor [Lachnospiraceae bacterium]
MKHILVIEDDCNIGNMLEEVLQKEGYQISRAYSGTEALLVLNSARPDLILLDLMLPGLNGEEILPQIKSIPVIIVSAKAGIDSKVELLLGGAADYVTKPFDIRELLARIAVQLRKGQAGEAHICSFEEIVLDLDSRQVTVGEEAVHLTRTEYAILKLLISNPYQVIPKSVMLDRIGGDTADGLESSLKVHISNLRKKLREVSGKEYIEAVWGIGFKLQESKS